MGEYQLAPTFSIVITREDDRLFGQATGQDRFRMFARDSSEFYLKIVEARVAFRRDGDGKVTGLVLYQNGREMPGPKVK